VEELAPWQRAAITRVELQGAVSIHQIVDAWGQITFRSKSDVQGLDTLKQLPGLRYIMIDVSVGASVAPAVGVAAIARLEKDALEKFVQAVARDYPKAVVKVGVLNGLMGHEMFYGHQRIDANAFKDL